MITALVAEVYQRAGDRSLNRSGGATSYLPTFRLQRVIMKRGFLLKAAEKKKGLSDKHDDTHPQKNALLTLQDIRSKLVLPNSREGMYRNQKSVGTTTDLSNRVDLPSSYRLPYGNLTEQDKGEDTDRYLPSVFVVNSFDSSPSARL